MEELLEKGVDMNARDKDGWTALMYASFRFSNFNK
uniref:Ankyrin repeat domain-containing protein n=1 Tax=candidate division WOR-3 bacterium TaxID=2052148 RepID=A0A7V6CN66_UNCW3